MQLEDQFKLYAAGTTVAYHTGFLANDRKFNERLDNEAELLAQLAQQGQVRLSQQRLGEGRYRYLATKT